MSGRTAAAWLGALLSLCSRAAAAPPEGPVGDRLAAARKHVEASDRYLHHSRLKRGMTGYGLSVFAGTTIERFDVEILSVMTRWGPKQDVILARCAGAVVDKAGIIAGMSGSPIYVQDPRDGKFKMIGALAYGWRFPKEPICGIQPITQMLAMGGVLDEARPPAEVASAGEPAAAPVAFLAAALDGRKADFSAFVWPPRRAVEGAGGAGGLVPLATPLMVSCGSPRTVARLARDLAPMGLVPMQAGGVGPAEAEAAEDVRLEPGSSVAIPLATGDADWSAVGTVTDVVGEKVLMFGHSFLAEGDVDLPMGTAYVHTVVPGLAGSFKLGSALRTTGAAVRDEYVGMSGRLGREASMVPMTVTVHWVREGLTERYRYGVARHPGLTGMLTMYLAMDAILGWREMPEHHTLRYKLSLEFENLGRIEAENVSSDAGCFALLSDATRPILTLQNNPLGPPPRLLSVEMEARIEEGSIEAEVLDLVLDGQVYRPGETVTGQVIVRPFRKDRTAIPVRFALPEDLPEGRHVLTASDADGALSRLRMERPHRFTPRTVEELREAIGRVLSVRADHLHLHLPLGRGGVALAARELPDLPDSKALILAQARPMDASPFAEALVRTVPTDYVLYGSAGAAFEVRREAGEIRIHQQNKDAR